MIEVVIFSKDRAAQLDLTLSSLKKYFKEWNQVKIHVLYKASDFRFQEGYNRLMQYHKDMQIHFVNEWYGFTQDTIRIINGISSPYIAFVVDDDIFIDYFSLQDPEFKNFFSNPNILCLSPRIAPYVNFCYTANIPSPAPKNFNPDRTWTWKSPELCGDWNYPMSIAAFHVFRTDDIKPLVNKANFRAPNSFEGTCLAPYPPARPLMICYDSCKCITSTNNRVQTENSNRFDHTDPVEELNRLFTAGHRLSTEANHQAKIPMCHGPCKYKWSV